MYENMLHSFEKMVYATARSNLNTFFMCFIYITSEEQNTESAVEISIRYLNVDI